jgi:von Willebrand factor type A domain
MDRFKLPSATLAAAMIMTALFATTAGANQIFTITVPKRTVGPAVPETAKMVLVVEDNGTANFLATVNGNNFKNAANPAADCTATDAACLGTFSYNSISHNARLDRHTLGLHTMQITFDLGNDLVSDLCGALPNGVTDRTVTVELPNVHSQTYYRMASYTVPALASADNTTPKCDTAFRRVDINGAFATVTGTAPAPPPPHHVAMDMVLVLDKSGSMNGGFSTPGVRIERLKTSAALFVNTWQSTLLLGNHEDRLALVKFDSTATGIPLDGTHMFKRYEDVVAWDGAVTKINNLSAGGHTTIGGSLVKAFQILHDESGPNDATIMLFSDGEQNTPPMLSGANPVKFNCATPCDVGGSNLHDTRLMDRATAILTVGLGPTGSSFFGLLDDVSRETAGRTALVFDPTAMDSAFVDNLVAALKGNTLSLSARVLGTMAPADATSAPLTANIDGSVKRVAFVMSWAGGNGDSAELAVVGPGGARLTPVVTKRGEFYRVFAYDIGKAQTIGEWQAVVLRKSNDGAKPPLQYHISVVASEGKLSYRFYDNAQLGTGLPVTLRAELGWDGKPLDNLPPGSIKAIVERPGENLGNILHDSKATGDLKNDSGDAQDPLSAKIDALVGSDRLFERTTPKPLPDTIELVHKGGGIYEATFDKAIVGGHYRLRFNLSWTDPRTDKISRSELVERSIPVLPDAASSITVTRFNTSAGTATVQIQPKDALGNLVGPGYASLFDVQVSGGGTPVLPLTDPAIRGEYTLQITGIPAGVDPQVKITYRGSILRAAPLSKLDPAGGAGGSDACKGLACVPWWVWILIILLVLLVVILIFRRRSA